jgi:hypothetical protein
MDADRDTCTTDRTGVWLIEAVQDLHQGALASTIFAQDSVDLSSVDIEIDVVVGQDMRESLGNATKAKIWRRRFCG